MTSAASARLSIASRSGSDGVNFGSMFHFVAHSTRVSATEVRELKSRAMVSTRSIGLRVKTATVATSPSEAIEMSGTIA
ncbi:hypothetical protein D3C83_175600 [compost metagenome]